MNEQNKETQESPSRSQLLRQAKELILTNPSALDVLSSDRLLSIILWQQYKGNRFRILKPRSQRILGRMYGISHPKARYIIETAKKNTNG